MNDAVDHTITIRFHGRTDAVAGTGDPGGHRSRAGRNGYDERLRQTAVPINPDRVDRL